MKNKTIIITMASALMALAEGGCSKTPETTPVAETTPAKSNDGIQKAKMEPTGAAPSVTSQPGRTPAQPLDPDSQLAQQVRIFLSNGTIGTLGAPPEKDLTPLQISA